MDSDLLDQDLCEQQLGQYRILAELGRGGFGCVYKASHTLMDRIVALKVIAPQRLEHERARDMFLREVRAATRLHHPNIALAYDAGEVDGRLFMAMEYIEGPTLEAFVRRHGPLPLNLAWALLQQTAQALRCAHADGMIHRDIKPANLLLSQAALEGRGSAPDVPALVKVVDFGLARVQTHSGSSTLFAGRDKVFAGTPDFISPEQARSLHDVDVRSDLYSLGATFYYALAGRKPFQGSHALEIILAHFEKEPEPLASLRPDLPPTLTRIIHRLMAKEPAQRYQSADELLAAMGGTDANLGTGSYPSWPQLFLPPGPVPGPPAVTPTVPIAPIARRPAAIDEFLSPTVQFPAHAAPIAASLASNESDPAGSPATVVTPHTNDDNRSGPTAVTAAHRPSHTLQQSWSQWSGLVAAVADGRKTAIDSADYRALHANLLRGLRDHSGANASDSCQRLHALLEPWLSWQTLADTDPAMLRDVLNRSRALAQAIGLHEAMPPLRFGHALAVIVLLVLPLAAIASMQLSTGRLSWHMPSLSAAWQFVNAHPVLTLTLLLPGSVLAGLHALGRLLRT